MRNKLFKNIRRQVHAKKSTVGSIVIAMLIVAVSISTFLIIIPEKTVAASTGYAYHKAITIESDYISTGLTNFPILVHDSTGNLSGNVLANGSDIAFYAVGNITQYNHEIERYNSGTGELWAWVNVTSVANGTDTIFYMYYSDSDGGYPVGYNPTSVWDGNYAGVYHFNGTMNDSTSNNKDLTNYGAVSQTDGISGGCYNFTSTDSDYADVAVITDVSALTQITIEAWVRATAIGGAVLNSGIMIGEYNAGVDADTDLIWYNIRRNEGEFASFIATPYQYSTFLMNQTIGNQIFFNHIWSYAAMTVDENVGADGTLWNYANGALVGSDDTSLVGSIDFSNITVDIMNVGRDHRSNADYYLDGSFDEIRISNILRSGSWLNASYHSQNETTGFLTLGTQQQQVSTYQIKGLPNDIITWAGTAGTTVYCNSSGDTNEWLEVNMSINATDNVTEIRVWVGDLNDTVAYINASNISLYVTNSANTTYYSFGTFADGGSNITINQTTWATYAAAIANPFNGTGLTDTNTSIFLIFKLAIPVTSPTDIFWSISSTAWKIYIGYI